MKNQQKDFEWESVWNYLRCHMKTDNKAGEGRGTIPEDYGNRKENNRAIQMSSAGGGSRTSGSGSRRKLYQFHNNCNH